MASGHYPLDLTDKRSGATELAAVADQLRDLLQKRGWMGVLPGTDDLTPEDAGHDGQYVGQLYLAVELIERAIRRPAAAPTESKS